jgi:hypothetical protein
MFIRDNEGVSVGHTAEAGSLIATIKNRKEFKKVKGSN